MIPPPPAISRVWKGAGGVQVGSRVVGDERWYLGDGKMSDELEMSDVF